MYFPLVPGEDLPLGLPVGARHHQVKARSWSVFIVRPQPGTPSCALRRCSEPLGWQGRGQFLDNCRVFATPNNGRTPRSEERRVGKECRTRWSPYHEEKECT